jgi:hypothetical protein
MAFGFEVGPGWLKILEKRLPDIDRIVKEKKLTDFRITQVKEKFGEIRIYSNWSIDEIDDVLHEIEDECGKTCETCGSGSAIFRTDGWLRVSCQECEDKMKLRREGIK